MPDARRLYLHVGLQKTGTSYLQAALLRSRDRLAEDGLDLVPPTKRESFELMVVTRDRYADRRDDESDRNILDRFTQQLADAKGTRAIYSQESLAAASQVQIERLLGLRRPGGARRRHRARPRSWSPVGVAGGAQGRQHGLLRPPPAPAASPGARGRRPQSLDPPRRARGARALGRNLPAERMHVITVPPSGSAPTLLLERFAEVLEVDPARLQPDDRPANTSLGLVQAEVLRRVNAELPEEVHRRYVYSDVVKRGFASGVLGGQAGVRILVPATFRAWCEEATDRQVAALANGGYDVVGSLDDLRCADRSFAAERQRARERDVAAASVSALSTLLAQRGTAVAERRTGKITVVRQSPVARVVRRLRGR